SIIDGLVKLIASISGNLGNIARGVQNGKVQSYFVWAVVGLLLVLIAII
ncbi:MAG: NADH-quinone oxidoreductase subunit L, partial [Bacteroidia bacterium]